MNRVLVYGASSDQGIPLINALIRKGYNVRAVTRNPEKYKNKRYKNIFSNYNKTSGTSGTPLKIKQS